MRIHVVNPNTTASMTSRIGAAARAAARADTDIVALNPASGPASIEGYFDEAFAVPGFLEEIVKGDRADGFVDRLFRRHGPRGGALRDRGARGRHRRSGVPHGLADRAPVLGRHHFVALDCADRGEPRQIRARPALRARARLRSPRPRARRPGFGRLRKASAEIGRALAQDGADAIVLGCAGMADLAAALAREHGAPVVDGVACAVKLVEALGGLGFKTSKRGPYAPPLAKEFRGAFAGMGTG